MFTTKDSLTDILSAPGMKKWLPLLFAEDFFDLFPGEVWEEPLRLSAFRGQTPWGSDLRGIAEQMIDAANLTEEIQTGKRQCLHLHDWNVWEPEERTDRRGAQQTFLITPPPDGKEEAKKPALIICPGGAYEFVSIQNEGTPIMIAAEKKGYVTFMLRYRVAPSRFPDPQLDLLESIRYVRNNAAKYQVDPDRIGIVGFSAGGHLCASAAALAETLLPEGKPNAVVLGYPVISLEKGIAHEGSALALFGKDDEALRREFSVENLITAAYPPTFAWTCLDDDCVPCENTKRLEAKLKEVNVAHACCYYPTGGHGCGLAYDNSAWRWSLEMFDFLEKYL